MSSRGIYKLVTLVQDNVSAQMPLMGFGTFKLTDPQDVNSALDAALSCGYRLIDSAQVYANEALIGAALQKLLPKHNLTRKDIFVTTKLHPGNMTEEPEKIRESLVKSLESLQIKQVDLFLIHYPAAGFGAANDKQKNKQIRAKCWKQLENLREEGLAKFIGVSNYTVDHLKEMNDYKTLSPAVNQCEFHPHMSRPELVQYCKQNSIHFQAFTSLGRNDPQLVEDAVILRIANKHKCTVAQVLLAWPMLQEISVLPKSSRKERIVNNFEAVNVQLTEQEIDELNKLDRGKNYTKCTPWLVA